MGFSFFKQIFSGRKQKTEKIEPSGPSMQFVLNYSEGREQTSRVSKEEIRRAIENLDKYGDVWLSNCRTVITPYGNCSGISCMAVPDGNPQVAVYFAMDDGLMRYVCGGYRPDDIVQMFYNYFERLEIPEISDWEKGHYTPVPPDDEPYYLYVDNEEYKYITYEDVLAALENLEAGKCASLLLRTPGCQNGYLEVRGTKDDYIVETGGNNEEGDWVVFMTHAPYIGRVRYWLYNYYHKREFPRMTDEWVDITEEVANNE
ncbi:hypothetical protein [uncultured Bacteroides sp.]|uniref:hypothetical protein n=1 Tax=uncultured Bacteroides sp. TaxID=162156 RepID=UPI0027DCD911|nr:hypothetical protein [uncultured Bacteroides sp.]